MKNKECTPTAFGKKTLTIEPAVPPKSPKLPRCVPNIVLNGFNRAYSGRRHGAFKNGKPTRCGSGRIFWVILEVGFFVFSSESVVQVARYYIMDIMLDYCICCFLFILLCCMLYHIIGFKSHDIMQCYLVI